MSEQNGPGILCKM